MKWRSAVVATVLAVFGLAASANAATIEGTLNWTGSVVVDVDTIDWQPVGPGGEADMTAPVTGYFAAFGTGINAGGTAYTDTAGGAE